MIRSIKQAYEIVRKYDPETAVTIHAIRTWCKQGKIKYLTCGNKVLVDINSLLNYLELKTA